MPVRLDPFQNIVGVNWGGKLAPIAYVSLLLEDNLGKFVIPSMVAPDESGFIETGANASVFFGPEYKIQGGLQFFSDPDSNVGGFGYRYAMITPMVSTASSIVDVRLLCESRIGSLPNIGRIQVIFGMERRLADPNNTVIFRETGIVDGEREWAVSEEQLPVPEGTIFRAVYSPNDRRFVFWGSRSFFREVPTLGQVADFGTVRMNFRRLTAEVIPPNTDPEEPPET